MVDISYKLIILRRFFTNKWKEIPLIATSSTFHTLFWDLLLNILFARVSTEKVHHTLKSSEAFQKLFVSGKN